MVPPAPGEPFLAAVGGLGVGGAVDSRHVVTIVVEKWALKQDTGNGSQKREGLKDT